jgi:predicted dehydrogenase
VLVEKPAATSAAEARRLADLAQSMGRSLCPVHQFPFQGGVRRIVRELPKLGRLVSVTHTVASAGGTARSESERRTLLLDILPHALALFRALLGPNLADAIWTVVTATADDLEVASEHGGTRLVANFSLRARPTRNELVVIGTAATARADLFHGFSTLEAGTVSRRAKILAPFRSGAGLLAHAAANLIGRAAGGESAYPGLLPLVRAFYASVQGGARVPIALDELVAIATAVEQIAGQRS